MLIGLTGMRGVGKSTIADMLVAQGGFTKLHAFGAGKAMVVAYYQHLGIDPETAYRLTYGDLKDKHHPLIPGDGYSRTFMEKLGYHMGVDMGCDYTLGAEVARTKRINPNAKILLESVVYEATYFREKLGGIIINIVRPEAEGSIVGEKTDTAVAAIKADYPFINSGTDKQATLVVFYTLLRRIARERGFVEPEYPENAKQWIEGEEVDG
jgi:hypothetical protein